VNTAFLETLARIAAVGSFRRAAEQLGTTQAAVSQRIRALEDELDARLLERGAKPVRLTAAGERVLQVAERMLLLERELKARARPDAAPSGRVRIGVIESVVHTWLTTLMRRVNERAPAVELDLTVDTARNLRERFRHGELQIIFQNDAIAVEPSGDTSVVVPLCRYPLRWVGRPGLFPARTLSPQDLERVPLITFSAQSSPHLQLRAHVEAQKLEPRITCCPSVAGILKLCHEGFGVAVIPPLFVRASLRRKKLRVYAGPELPALSISVAYPRAATSALQLIAAEAESVVSSYCAQAGSRWAQPLTRAR
jgi:DNA-binding transcriptional LysR family regulator